MAPAMDKNDLEGRTKQFAVRIETRYWLELFEEASLGICDDRQWLLKEANELLAIFTASGRTAKSRRDAESHR